MPERVHATPSADTSSTDPSPDWRELVRQAAQAYAEKHQDRIRKEAAWYGREQACHGFVAVAQRTMMQAAFQ